MDISTTVLLILFFAALAAGFIDTLAGGGGLLTIPALLLAGVPPLAALATNKVQSVFGVLTASVTLIRRGWLDWRALKGVFLIALLGSMSGALAVHWINPDWLRFIVPCVLAAIALYYLLSPQAGELETQPRVSPQLYQRAVLPAIGAYDGMFGPGTGSFYTTSGVALRGMTLLQATVQAKWLNLATNLGAVLIFVASGQVVWILGGVMLLGQMLGAWLGTLAVIRGGSRLIRPLLVTLCLVMLARYFFA
ncbi:TSUP family transporter [Marinospirillum sp. MEB164]|uniref:Probable membrane transporter protein n=1 Tax=Marinospirillum alkalitolerans TaxID=3123374 RepID=A0ABW8PYD4_9GAMM